MTEVDGATAVVPYWSDDDVETTLATLRAGGLVLIKGDIGYGLFGRTRESIETMYRLKGRPYSNPCIVAGNLDVLDDVAEAPPAVRAWIAETAAWTTMAAVLPARPASRLLAGLDPWLRQQATRDDSVAVFLRTGPFIEVLVARALAEGWPLVGSSANPSSTGNRYALDEIPEEIRAGADHVVDHGTSALANDGRLATTIVNFTTWEIQRRGVNVDAIEASFGRLRAEVGR